MGGDRSRVLVLAFGYLATIVPALFVIDWFFLDLGVASIHIDLRRGSTLGTATFWGSLLFVVPLVGFQTFTRVTSGTANAKLSRYGIYAVLVVLTCGLGAGYLFAPEMPGPLELVPPVERTIAPVLFVVANVLAIAALHYAALETTDDTVGTYQKVVVARPVTEPPVARPITEPPVARPTTQPSIDKPITRPPIDKPITQPPIDKPITRPPITRSSTIPIAKHTLQYLVMSGEITRAGIDARREDGTSLLVLWRDVVGVVVRRLPDELDATTFMDVVSVKGSTLRIVPWTRLTGISVVGAGDDRVRSIAGYIASMCSGVQLFDPATKNFLEKPDPAAQLKDLAKLAAHDERLS
ncbi:MAG: hypothetical protein ACKV2T_15540 [Kofleriaceae bacterium]